MFEKIFGASDGNAVLTALSRSLAIIEFDPTGKILTANENFCRALGYDLSEVKGQHHSMFVEPGYARSQEYRDFWGRLGAGEFDAGEYDRIAKGGRPIWIQASYNPVLSGRGKVIKVVKCASVVTDAKLRNAEFEGKINAISRAQAMIEFTPAGEIVTANENFLNAMGYRLEEIKGQHHRMFVDAAESQTSEYTAFWARLNQGDYIAAEFKRRGRGGKEVWIQASYNPIFDMNKKVVKVVKFATDITERVKSVAELGGGLAKLCDGDLKHRVTGSFPAPFEQLRVDLNHSVDQLQSTMAQVIGSTDAIASGTREISSAADDLSRRTEQQAASLEQTAAALDQITATVKRTAAGSRQAREVVAAATADTEQSGIVVEQAVAAMGAIQSSAREISQIIGVIDEIAFQTNLLALNAGVEAARAGDAGRGFAVVASEVRALAQRSAEAAKEIKALISSSTTHVTAGVNLVGETGKALKRISAQITDINGVVIDIAASAQEQATGLNEINTAINQMDQVTQQNAAMVEQSTAASRTLANEAEDLTRLIGKFEVGGAPAAAEPRSSSRPARRAASKPAAAKVVTFDRAPRSAAATATAHDTWEEF